MLSLFFFLHLTPFSPSVLLFLPIGVVGVFLSSSLPHHRHQLFVVLGGQAEQAR